MDSPILGYRESLESKVYRVHHSGTQFTLLSITFMRAQSKFSLESFLNKQFYQKLNGVRHHKKETYHLPEVR